MQPIPHIRKTLKMRCISRDDLQGDTGANCSATNNRDLLWNCKALDKPIPIMTYEDSSQTMTQFEAIGTGILKMIVEDTTLNWLTLYVPHSNGTVISPDR